MITKMNTWQPKVEKLRELHVGKIREREREKERERVRGRQREEAKEYDENMLLL